ncbi:electron transfer flavoprotein subunit beta/FixA family protein [Uliginosibacterium paludis]|uniref:Electron transfer flavoprotein subunit beta n=1 Tax=Uliginosibacterium paludis TaxID=1615952 RepID=A0ABV2CRY4_9RHOO
MKILVPVKRVVDHEIRVRVKPDGSGLDESGLRYAMNPFDEIALEEALRLREAGICSEIVIASCGDAAVQDTLRHGLALGADRAIRIDTPVTLQPLGVAKLLKALALQEAPQLILMGKQATDSDAAQTGPMLAAMLGWPQGCFASALSVKADRVEVRREIDGGLETLSLSLPALVTTDLRLNLPRFVTLANTMKARRKTIELMPAESFGVDFMPRLRVLRSEAPPERLPGEMLDSVSALAGRLKPFLADAEAQA